VILGADSLVDQRSLTWLQGNGRLKNDQNPVGLVPGEAGVCLMIEPRAAAEQRGARPRARIRAAVTCEDVDSGRVDERASRNLASCVRTALSSIEGTRIRGATMFTDLNGETSRAVRLGTAMALLTDCLVDPAVEHPAECFGETGAAFGALSTCLAVGSFDRGYARSAFALVANTDDSGSAACVVLQQP
jgi:3-oxoacyl-[acyl-carrier-protein] synthase-1